MNWLEKHWEALAVGGVVGLLGVFVWKEAHAAPSTVVNPMTPSNTPTGVPATSWTLPAGQSGSTVLNVPTGGYLTLFLPASGGTWNSLTLAPSGTSVPVSGAEPATFIINAAAGTQATATAVWTDSSGKQYTDTITINSTDHAT